MLNLTNIAAPASREKSSREKASAYLSAHTGKRWVHDRLVDAIGSDSSVSMFPPAVRRLTTMVRNEHVHYTDICEVVEMDQGLSAKCLRAANSVAYGGNAIKNLDEALFMIGIDELKRLIYTLGVVDNFNHLRIKLNWQPFWIHSILVARLTEKLAAAFRPTTGIEYLSGLLHDIGKLILEHYFPREFEDVLLTSLQKKCGWTRVEDDLLGVNHATIGAALCQAMNLDPQIVQAVQFHHQPLHPVHVHKPNGDRGFLACCIHLANMLANLERINIGGYDEIKGNFDELPEWVHLTSHFDCAGLELNLDEEIAKAKQKLDAMCES